MSMNLMIVYKTFIFSETHITWMV